MSARELQQACRDRGLPTARDKDTMIGRLAEADGAVEEPQPAEGGHDAVQEPAEPAAAARGAAPEGPVPAVWQERYPARGNGISNAEHQANCAAVVAAARARGYTPQGGGRRAGTQGGMHVYEVYLRRGPL